MHKNSIILGLAAWTAFILLASTGCGQKGALYLPPPQLTSPANAANTASSPAANPVLPLAGVSLPLPAASSPLPASSGTHP